MVMIISNFLIKFKFSFREYIDLSAYQLLSKATLRIKSPTCLFLDCCVEFACIDIGLNILL